jgi:hypothetical protein
MKRSVKPIKTKTLAPAYTEPKMSANGVERWTAAKAISPTGQGITAKRTNSQRGALIRRG